MVTEWLYWHIMNIYYMNTDKTVFLTLLLLLWGRWISEKKTLEQFALKKNNHWTEWWGHSWGFLPQYFLKMSLVIWIESTVEPCEAPSWFRLGLSHLPFQPPWQLNASSNQKPSMRAGVRLLGTGGTLREADTKQCDIGTHWIDWCVCNPPLKATLETFGPHVAYSGQTREMWEKHPHAIGPLHPVTRTQRAGQTMNSNWV